MASTAVKKPCVKCSKGNGIFTCDGCQQSFCRNHSNEHRQELATQMDILGQEHDLLRRDLNREDVKHPLLSRIDVWEQESITKIQITAEEARTDLQKWIDRTKNQLMTSVNKMTDELQCSRESDDYTEIDFKRWMSQLEELRKMVEAPSIIDIVDDNKTSSSIRLIKVKENHERESQRTSRSSEENVCAFHESIPDASERFDKIVGKITLSEGGLRATSSDLLYSGTNICGVNQYSSGIHHIHFRIEQMEQYSPFFGIITSSQNINSAIWNSRSAYGWWDVDCRVVNGKQQESGQDKIIRNGDEVTLTLDCDKTEIRFKHHRTNTIVNQPISLRNCPFPWKILVSLYDTGYCVRILR